MPPGYDSFNSSRTQKSHQILVPRLASVSHKLPKMIGQRHLKWLELSFCFLLSVSVISLQKFGHTHFTISAKIKLYTKDEKAKKPTLGSHSISVHYVNIVTYFRVTNNKVKAILTILSGLFQIN